MATTLPVFANVPRNEYFFFVPKFPSAQKMFYIFPSRELFVHAGFKGSRPTWAPVPPKVLDVLSQINPVTILVSKHPYDHVGFERSMESEEDTWITEWLILSFGDSARC